MSIQTVTVVHEGITMRIHTQDGKPINWVADTVNGPVLIPMHMQPEIQRAAQLASLWLLLHSGAHPAIAQELVP